MPVESDGKGGIDRPSGGLRNKRSSNAMDPEVPPTSNGVNKQRNARLDGARLRTYTVAGVEVCRGDASVER